MDADRIQAIFLDEASRRLAEIDQILCGPFPRQGTPELLTLQRHAHTLTGTASTLGHPTVAQLARQMWTHLENEQRGLASPREVEPEVRREFEGIREEIGRLRAARSPQ